jgi:hypothetical protein
MTLPTPGLEFEHVFVVGMEEGPSRTPAPSTSITWRRSGGSLRCITRARRRSPSPTPSCARAGASASTGCPRASSRRSDQYKVGTRCHTARQALGPGWLCLSMSAESRVSRRGGRPGCGGFPGTGRGSARPSSGSGWSSRPHPGGSSVSVSGRGEDLVRRDSAVEHGLMKAPRSA